MGELATYLSSVRDRLAVVVQRRDDLQRRLAEVTHDHDRLVAVVSLLQEDLENEAFSPSDVPEDPPPLAVQILAELPGSAGKTRADFQRVFRRRGVNANTVDSALDRLRKRRELVKRGKYYFRSAQASASPSSASSSDLAAAASGPDPDPAGPGRVAGDAPSGKARSRPPGAASAALSSAAPDPSLLPVDERPLTLRIHERVAASGGCTRAALVRHFRVPGKAVDDVLRAFKGRGRLERRADGVWVVCGSNVPADDVPPHS